MTRKYHLGSPHYKKEKRLKAWDSRIYPYSLHIEKKQTSSLPAEIARTVGRKQTCIHPDRPTPMHAALSGSWGSRY